MNKNKKIIFTFFISFLSFTTYCQDFENDFKNLRIAKDTSGQLKLLKNWESTKPKDPELFIAYFNYFVQQSMVENISLDTKRNNQQSLQLNDTGTGKPAGYINFSTHYESSILNKGFQYIDKGIALYPSRLDMHFGKIYMLGEAQNYSEFTKVLIETIEYGNKINNAWIWKNGKPVEDPLHFFLKSMQTYINTIYNTEDDNLLPLMRQISETVLKYHPDHIESLANVALTYLIIQKYDLALPYLLKAEKLAPADVVVLNNIAQTYKWKNDKVNAKIYYEKIIKYGNEDEIENAKEKLNELE